MGQRDQIKWGNSNNDAFIALSEIRYCAKVFTLHFLILCFQGARLVLQSRS